MAPLKVCILSSEICRSQDRGLSDVVGALNGNSGSAVMKSAPSCPCMPPSPCVPGTQPVLAFKASVDRRQPRVRLLGAHHELPGPTCRCTSSTVRSFSTGRDIPDPTSIGDFCCSPEPSSRVPATGFARYISLHDCTRVPAVVSEDPVCAVRCCSAKTCSPFTTWLSGIIARDFIGDLGWRARGPAGCRISRLRHQLVENGIKFADTVTP